MAIIPGQRYSYLREKKKGAGKTPAHPHGDRRFLHQGDRKPYPCKDTHSLSTLERASLPLSFLISCICLSVPSAFWPLHLPLHLHLQLELQQVSPHYALLLFFFIFSFFFSKS